jgi:hypothetical protein
METKTKNFSVIILLLLGMHSIAFSNVKRIAVLRIETNSEKTDPLLVAQLVRYNFQKRDSFNLVGKEEMTTVLEEKGLNLMYFSTDDSKYKAGKALGCEYVLTGKITMGRKSTVLFKLYNVNAQMEAGRTFLTFTDGKKDIEKLIEKGLVDLLEKNEQMMQPAIIPPASGEAAKNGEEPEYTKVNWGGPRMGYTFLTGNMAKLFKAPTKAGGYDCTPAFFQFGYQFEACYVSHGNMQGLFEFIPTITGMDQSKIFPSLTMLNGFRNTRYGIEIALGPTIYIRREARGYYDVNAQWHLKNEWNPNKVDANGIPYTMQNPSEIITRADSRGDAKLASGVVIALGKTFHSGNLNLPVNAYMVPGKSGWRFGISAGFNLKNSKKGISSVTR